MNNKNIESLNIMSEKFQKDFKTSFTNFNLYDDYCFFNSYAEELYNKYSSEFLNYIFDDELTECFLITQIFLKDNPVNQNKFFLQMFKFFLMICLEIDIPICIPNS